MPPVRRGFTLTEMIVSLAIVVFAMAIVANVFSLTTRTTQATAAVRETRQAMRNLFTEIRADLQGVDPAKSILVLSGWTQAAALTDDNITARRYYRVLQGDPAVVPPDYNPETATVAANGYSNPRTDAMMFITNRPGVSKAPPVNAPTQTNQEWARFHRELYQGVGRSPQLVVYGHAALARPGGLSSPQHIPLGNQGQVISPIPISRWQLARRAAIIRDATTTGGDTLAQLFPGGQEGNYSVQMNRLVGYQADGALAGDALAFDLSRFFRIIAPHPNPANLNILQPGQNAVLRDPYALLSWPPADQERFRNLLFREGDFANRHVATIVEDAVSAGFANQALRALAGCSWFQVEFLMPEDPRNSRQHPDARQWSSPERWVTIQPGQIYVFVPDSPENRTKMHTIMPLDAGPLGPLPGAYRPFFEPVNEPARLAAGDRRVYIIRTWPYAVRITVRAIDPEDRLPEPLVRSMVHRFD